MSSLVATLPKDYPKDADPFEYFRLFMLFCIARYGKESVGIGFVHMDETTPHMHLTIIPFDKDGCINRKAVFNPTELNKFHRELQSYMDERLGFHSTSLLDEKALLAKAKSRMTEDEVNVLDAHIEARVKEETAAERRELRSWASKLDVREEEQENEGIRLKSCSDALDEREDKVSTRERRVASRENTVAKRETAVSKREDTVAKRENVYNVMRERLLTWWKRIMNWLGEELSEEEKKTRLEEANRQGRELTDELEKTVTVVHYDGSLDEDEQSEDERSL
jgi:hypothetical protein